MARLEALDWEAMRSVTVYYHELLVSHCDHLNRMNVYPVPDHDTGTNLERTLRSVVGQLDTISSMGQFWTAAKMGVLEGAQGTSGIVIAQMATAIARDCEHFDEVTSRQLARGLGRASDAAYSAVVEPMEGTILTVARKAASAALAAEQSSLIGVIEVAQLAARTSLEETPKMVPALAQAGVIDAGGAGFALLFDALLHVVDGRELPKPPKAVHVGEQKLVSGPPLFEVVVRLSLERTALTSLRGRLAELGDEATVVAEADGSWLAHLHTHQPDAAIEAAKRAGSVDDIRVTELPW